MKCDNLKAYLDNQLRFFDRLVMRAHTRSCAECRQNTAIWSPLSREIERLEGEPVPPTLREKLMADAIAAAASTRARQASTPIEQGGAQRVWRIRKAYLAAAFVVLMVAVGFGLFPYRTANSALAEVARAMSKVKSVHFVAWKAHSTGKRGRIEGWVVGSSKMRIRTESGGAVEDFADDGSTVVEVNTWARPPYATIYRSETSARWPMDISIDLFRGRGLLKQWENPLRPYKMTSREITLTNGRKAVVYELNWPGQKTLLTVDPDSDLIVGLENLKFAGTDQEVREVVERIEYNVEIPDSVFTPAIPKGIPVLDLTRPVPAAVLEWREAEMKRLRADPNVKVFWSAGGGYKSRGGVLYRPGFRIEVAGSGPVMMAYLPEADLYRVVGTARVFSEDGSYSRFVEDQDVRLPGQPQYPKPELLLSGGPGSHGGLDEHDPHRGFRRFVNVGNGPLTITFKCEWGETQRTFFVKGTAKLVPFGVVCKNQTIKENDLPDIEAVRDPNKLDWGGLPASEIEVAKAELDVQMRVREIFSTKDAKGRVLIDGERVRITYHCDGTYCSGRVKIVPAGVGPTATTLGIRSKRVYVIIGRVKVFPSGDICENGRVSFSGKVLSSEE